MSRLAPHASTVAHLRALGQVVAWRAGVAHFRAGALEAADALVNDLGDAAALDALGARPTDSWPSVRDKLNADPWWSPDPKRATARNEGIEIGRFAGFGGTFKQPPEVRESDCGFVVKSGERYFLLIADVYGAVLHAATAADYEEPPSRNPHAVAVTSPFTHAIRLLPRA